MRSNLKSIIVHINVNLCSNDLIIPVLCEVNSYAKLLPNSLVLQEIRQFLLYINFSILQIVFQHFISPYSSAGRGLPGKELHAGQISHQGNDFVAGLVRLFAVGFNRGNDKLMDVGGLPLRVSLGSQQAYFRVAPRPEAEAVKPAIRLLVLFQPNVSNAFIGEAPSLDQPECLRELRESVP